MAAVGGTPEEQGVISELLGIPVLMVDDPGHYGKVVETARVTLGVSAVRVIREVTDPAPLPAEQRLAVTLNLSELERGWPLLLDTVQTTVADLDLLAAANREPPPGFSGRRKPRFDTSSAILRDA